MEELFKNKGLRLTAFRKEVYKIFQHSNAAISTTLIENELKSFDRITLYRTLKLFKEKGIIHEILFPNNEKMLALCKEKCEHHGDFHQHDHIHFKCHQCEDVFCVDIPRQPEINVSGFQIDQLEIQAVGKCNKCS